MNRCHCVITLGLPIYPPRSLRSPSVGAREDKELLKSFNSVVVQVIAILHHRRVTRLEGLRPLRELLSTKASLSKRA